MNPALDLDPVVKKRDAWAVVLLFDPLAIPLARWFAKRQTSPSAITIVSLIVGLVCAGFAYWWSGATAATAVAATYYLSFLLDCVDGKVARARRLTSEDGATLDLMCDALKMFALDATILLEALRGSESGLSVFYLIGILLGLNTYKTLSHLRVHRKTATQQQTHPLLEPLRPRWFPKRFTSTPQTIDIEVLLFMVWLPWAQAGSPSIVPLLVAALLTGGLLSREAIGVLNVARSAVKGRPD